MNAMKESINECQQESPNLPWSLLDSEGFPEGQLTQSVTNATGTTTHSASKPRDLNVDDS